MRIRWMPDAMSLMAVLIGLVSIYQTGRGNVLVAVVAALNGITVALVALGYRMAARQPFPFARGGVISGPTDGDSIPTVISADQAVRMPVPPWRGQP